MKKFTGKEKEIADEIVNGFVELTAKHTLELFMKLGLESHIEATVFNDATGDEFEFIFRKKP